MNLNETDGVGAEMPLPSTVVEDAAAYNLTNTPTVGGYIFWHARATDIVLFGPFRTLDDAWDWWEAHGNRLGVSPVLTHLRSPGVTYRGLWDLMPEENEA
jgi:hypothetical protein